MLQATNNPSGNLSSTEAIEIALAILLERNVVQMAGAAVIASGVLMALIFTGELLLVPMFALYYAVFLRIALRKD